MPKVSDSQEWKKSSSQHNRRLEPPRTRIWLVVGIILVTIAAIAIRSRWWMDNPQPTKRTISIGAILPQTGAGAVFAQYIQEGMNLAVEDLNAKGEPQIKVFYEDSKNLPREGVTAYNKLVSDEKPPVVIVALSSVAKALAPLAQQSNTAQVYIAVAIPDITDGEYRFRVYPEAQGMAGVMAKFNTKRLNAKSSAVIYINDDFGRVSLNAYRAAAESQGSQVVFAESYELQQTDFRALISKLKNVDPPPEVIYLSGYGPSYGAFVRQLKEQKAELQLTADMTMGLPNTLEQVGDAADGVYFVDGKASPEFVEKFTRKYGKEPSSYAGYAYDIVNLLYKTAREKGVFTADSVREGLLKTQDYPGAMGKITIQSDGDSNLQFVVKRVTGQTNKIAEESQ